MAECLRWESDPRRWGAGPMGDNGGVTRLKDLHTFAIRSSTSMVAVALEQNAIETQQNNTL